MAVLAVSMRLVRPSIWSTCALRSAARSIAAAAACRDMRHASHGNSPHAQQAVMMARCLLKTYSRRLPADRHIEYLLIIPQVLSGGRGCGRVQLRAQHRHIGHVDGLADSPPRLFDLQHFWC